MHWQRVFEFSVIIEHILNSSRKLLSFLFYFIPLVKLFSVNSNHLFSCFWTLTLNNVSADIMQLLRRLKLWTTCTELNRILPEVAFDKYHFYSGAIVLVMENLFPSYSTQHHFRTVATLHCTHKCAPWTYSQGHNNTFFFFEKWRSTFVFVVFCIMRLLNNKPNNPCQKSRDQVNHIT